MAARTPISCCVMLALSAIAKPQADKNAYYAFDPPDREIAATVLDGPERYEPDVVATSSGLLLTWLEHVPGRGDHIWIGPLAKDKARAQCLTAEPTACARPSLTVARDGVLWLTYETRSANGGWDIEARRRSESGSWERPRRVSPGSGSDLNHRAVAAADSGIWVVWQGDRGGQFDVLARRVHQSTTSPAYVVSESPRGDWQPDVAALDDGQLCVVWDSFDGESFNVLARWRSGDAWQSIVAVARSPAFEARARVAASPHGTVWVAWEEGAKQWGRPYRSLDGRWNNATDAYGPVHRFRRLRLARLGPYASLPGGVVCSPPLAALPMPSFAAARQRDRARPGVGDLGVFYERPQLAVDRHGRAWVMYRHYADLQLGRAEPVVHHIEVGWKLFARRLDPQRGWSQLLRFDVPQRDGMQRFEIAPHGDGIAAVWDTGRTDRRTGQGPRGIATATAVVEPGEPSGTTPGPGGPLRQITPPPPISPRPDSAILAGTTQNLFFGDLHRHTDLSLCFPFFDGSVDDAYRYAIEVAELDFLGITDHTRDIARGDARSQLWWRCTKEVERHRLTRTFFPYFAFERSHRDTDHNVISLRRDMLRNFPPPLPEFWAEIEDRDTFTIPHRPFIGSVWEHHDDARRPLLEIYQGLRDKSSQEHAHDGLGRGYHLGFIASSDHMATSSSYACVWAPAADREVIFRSLQARRTYGATAKIRLVFRAGDHWMGERLTAPEMPIFDVDVTGTAGIHWIEVYRDGAPALRLGGGLRQRLRTRFRPGRQLAADREHWVYVHVMQIDGNQAWSSPIWVKRG